MPCSGNDGSYAPGDVANSRVDALQRRVAELEAAFCGLLKSLPGGAPDSITTFANEDLRRWWANHIRQPGHMR